MLDEPTNDLDLESIDLLESMLQSYPGTLLLVSHDRRFLDNVVTSVLVAQGDGHWLELVGGYSDWLAWRQTQPNQAPSGFGAAPSGRSTALARMCAEWAKPWSPVAASSITPSPPMATVAFPR